MPMEAKIGLLGEKWKEDIDCHVIFDLRDHAILHHKDMWANCSLYQLQLVCKG